VAEKSRFGAKILLEPSGIGGVRRSTLFPISRVAWFDRFTTRAVAQRVRRDLLGDPVRSPIAGNGPILAANPPANSEPPEEQTWLTA
jgi:hypothetical protein